MCSTCYVLCRLNSNSRMYFALKLHEVSPCPCPYPCLEGMVLVLILVFGGQVLVLVLGGSVLVNITARKANTKARALKVKLGLTN